MAETRTERTEYLGLLALMMAAHDTDGWSYPYWNIRVLDAALAALADAPRDGVAHLLAPSGAPTAVLSSSPGLLAGGLELEIGQTFVDAYGRETDVGPLAAVSTGEELASPDAPPTLGAPTLGGLSGYEGGLLEVWYSWTDGAGGETLPSPSARVEIPYQTGGLRSEIVVALPSLPAAAGAAGANIYIQHRGGNIVLAYRILTDDVDEVTLTGAIADCFRSLPLANSAGSNKAVDITGALAPSAAVTTRFYIRTPGTSWTAVDSRLRLGGVDEWDPATVVYPLIYAGAYDELAPGFPPVVSQVKAIRPIDLATEAVGDLPVGLLPGAATLDSELARSIGEAVISGLAVSAHTPADMGVNVAIGEVLLAAGRFVHAQDTDLAIPAADATHPRIDIICVADDGVMEGPTESASLKGTPLADPDAPSTPAGYIKLAEVTVGAGATEIAGGNISDERWVVPTLAAAVVELRNADAAVEDDLQTHELDAQAHSSKAGAFAQVNRSCAGSETDVFAIPCSIDCLVTSVKLVCTSGGVIDYDFEFFTDSGRTILAYKAEGIDTATWEDRIPWEWFSGATFYGRITNNSGDAIANLAIDVKYRK